MSDPVIRRLDQHAPLSDEDRQALRAALGPMRRVAPGIGLLEEGSDLQSTYLIQSGWACLLRQLVNGKRQIVAFLLPGDLHNPLGSLRAVADCTLMTFTPVTLSEVPAARMRALAAQRPQVGHALHLVEEVRAATLAEWVINLGVRPATERLGSLFCELFLRLRAVGLAEGDRCEFPLTQTTLAEALGLTPVHVNRTLRALRAADLIALADRHLIIPDLAALQAYSGFNPRYLGRVSLDRALS